MDVWCDRHRGEIMLFNIFDISFGEKSTVLEGADNYYNEKNNDENTAKSLCRLDGDGLTVIEKYFCQ